MDSLNRRSSWLACFAVLALAGCASWQDFHYEASQKLRTECAWLDYWWCNPHWTNSDYKKGWQAGYFDVITGGDGQPPLVAPHEYWNPKQILVDCDQRRHDWYVGFQDGAMIASTQPDTHYVKLWNPPSAYCPPPVVQMAPVEHPAQWNDSDIQPLPLDAAPEANPMPPLDPLPPMDAPPEAPPMPPLVGSLPPFPMEGAARVP